MPDSWPETTPTDRSIALLRRSLGLPWRVTITSWPAATMSIQSPRRSGKGLEPTLMGAGSEEDDEVELTGIEPVTSAVPRQRSPS